VRREEREAQKESQKRPREEEEDGDVVGRSTGPGVWADNDVDAYGEEGGGEKRARVE